MKVFTAGSAFLDIDAYGSMIAAAELSNVLGVDAIAATTAVVNESVTATIRSWGSALQTNYTPSLNDQFVVLDISDPDFFDSFVDPNRIIGVIDHHPGFEAYWQEILGDGARIEEVGAACTLVFEDWVKSGKLSEISELSARLLVTGILDNTLNFGATITKQRDHDAYRLLLPYANLPDDWPARYFTECQQAIEDDIRTAIENDSKRGLKNLPEIVCQLLVWDGAKLLDERQQEILDTLHSMSDKWCLNLISLKDGISYIVAQDPTIQKQLATLLHLKTTGLVVPADRLWLRKEILKAALTTT